MRLILTVLLSLGIAGAQTELPNRVTFSGGWSHQVNGYPSTAESATTLGISYGHRLGPHIELEGGFFVALHPGTEVRGATYDYLPTDRFTWAPFGVRFIAPLRQDRVELSLGGGGLYERYSPGSFTGLGFQPYNSWGGYAVAGAAVALDRGRHFWLGGGPRVFFANSGFQHDRWFHVAGEFSFRF